MKSIIVSMYVKKDIYSILFIDNGFVVEKSVGRLQNADDVILSKMLDVLNIVFRKVRGYTEKHNDITDIVFELNNSTIIKWFDKVYSVENYQERFVKLLDLLDELPISYMFSYNKEPLSKNYAKKEYLDKLKLTSIFEEI